MAEHDGSHDEQKVSQVAALRAERTNAEAYGDTVRVAAVDRQLADLGAAPKARAAAERAAEAAAEPEARNEPPRERRHRPTQTVDVSGDNV